MCIRGWIKCRCKNHARPDAITIIIKKNVQHSKRKNRKRGITLEFIQRKWCHVKIAFICSFLSVCVFFTWFLLALPFSFFLSRLLSVFALNAEFKSRCRLCCRCAHMGLAFQRIEKKTAIVIKVHKTIANSFENGAYHEIVVYIADDNLLIWIRYVLSVNH